MLISATLLPQIPSSPISPNHHYHHPLSPISTPNFPPTSIPLTRRRTLVCAENNNGFNMDPPTNNGDGGEGVDNGLGDLKNDNQPIFQFSLRWRDLLDPDPQNIVAVGLTGLLSWASVQVLWQLFFISISILVAALKYSFVAALLLFILVTLL